MFTGLIEDLGKIKRMTRQGDDVTVQIETSIPLDEIALGDSIAVNGVCLTATTLGDGTFTADASVETMSRTALGDLKVGDEVHLERALRVGDRMGGHMVQGHVDGTGHIERSVVDGKAWQVWVSMPNDLRDELVEKGSITVDGISLTVNEVTATGCRLTIVGFTDDKTMITRYPVGRRVNIETDIIGKYVRRFLGMDGGAGGGTAALLERYGYTSK